MPPTTTRVAAPLTRLDWVAGVIAVTRSCFAPGLLALVLFGSETVSAADPPAADDPKAIAFFESKVRTILLNRCATCHGPEKQKGGLRLDSQDSMRRGGDSGPAVVVGDSQYTGFLIPIVFPGNPVVCAAISLIWNLNHFVNVKEGVEDLMVNRARCCNPLHGEEIVGYISRGKGVAVHTKRCKNVKQLMVNLERAAKLLGELSSRMDRQKNTAPIDWSGAHDKVMVEAGKSAETIDFAPYRAVLDVEALNTLQTQIAAARARLFVLRQHS